MFFRLVPDDTFLRFLGNLLLAYVRRVSHDCIEHWEFNLFPLCVIENIGQFTERFTRFNGKEILANDAWVVFFLCDIAGGEVQSRKVSGKRVDVATVETSDQFLVRHALVTLRLPVVGPNEERS